MTPAMEQVERTMKKSKAREWTIWELVERTGYSYSSVHLALGGLVERKIVTRRKLTSDGRLGNPGFGFFIQKKKPVSTAKKQVAAK